MIDIRMWGRALEQMPKLSEHEWQALDPVARWLIACRASVPVSYTHLRAHET